jgi:excisionase family DNA binding protein
MEDSNMEDELYTIVQVAEYLKVCDKTVRRLIKKKLLCASKVGGSWRIKFSEIERYLKNTQNGTEE